MAEDFDRIPPQDIDAEISVLGSAMSTTDATVTVTEEIRGSDFYMLNHEIIFDAIVDLFGQNESADTTTVVGYLQREGTLPRVGGAPYLHTLIASVPAAADAGYYAYIICGRAIMRRLVIAGTYTVQLGYAEIGGETEEIVEQAQSEVYAVFSECTTRDYVAVGSMTHELLEYLKDIERFKGKLQGVPTGFKEPNDLIQGLRGGQMIIVTAGPAMGKSTLVLDFYRSAPIKYGVTSLVFSLEMSQQEIAMRMLITESGVFLSKIQAGSMNDADWKHVARTMERVSDAPLYIDDSLNMTITETRVKYRQLKQQHSLGLVVIDYLQLMTSSRQVEFRQQEASAMPRNLELLARDIGVPVVAVAQFNRNSESRNDRKPMISDLCESGSLEQDVDIIMLLHRPNYHDKEDRPGEGDITTAEHRNGETVVTHTLFQGHLLHFVNYSGREEPHDT